MLLQISGSLASNIPCHSTRCSAETQESPIQKSRRSSSATTANSMPGQSSYHFLFERSWTADERTAPKIKSQEAVRIRRDADSDALPDFAGFVIVASEP